MDWFRSNTSKAELYETMVRAYSAELFRFAFWLSHDRNIAEDLTQETCLRAWRNWHSLKDIQATKKWLFTILRREHARLYQSDKPQLLDVDTKELENLMVYDDFPTIELNDVLVKLPLTYREPLLLQVLGGFTCNEIGEIVGTSEAAVMARVSRARRMMRELLNDTDIQREKLK